MLLLLRVWAILGRTCKWETWTVLLTLMVALCTRIASCGHHRACKRIIQSFPDGSADRQPCIHLPQITCLNLCCPFLWRFQHMLKMCRIVSCWCCIDSYCLPSLCHLQKFKFHSISCMITYWYWCGCILFWNIRTVRSFSRIGSGTNMTFLAPMLLL
jgi:hypothetical protein